ncbi:hypothetical protein DL96DRAFT_1527004 [Flagelloscypha sp. PMI_526]|nr:hypothetical protein DL96DRAFT_1527004 [Flagelloscypha sp. PMI_526]
MSSSSLANQTDVNLLFFTLIMSMDEVIPRLWVGDLRSALDVALLRSNGVFSVLSAMRGKVRIHETFIRHQIDLDDSEEEDIIVHFLPSISFIQAELDKGRGVLVHCQAGMSRSVAIVAAYIMYTEKKNPQEALKMIRSKRPFAEPNVGFHDQLQVFYDAAFNVSGNSKEARRFYMNRTTEGVMNGDGTYDSKASEFFAAAPPITPTAMKEGRSPRRRIRCKMCRQELAAREHMLDHGQIGDPTPAMSPVSSRRPSSSIHGETPRRKSIGLGGSGLTMSPASPVPRPNILNAFSMSSMADPLKDAQNSSAIDSGSESEEEETSERTARKLGRRISDAMLAPSQPPGPQQEEPIQPAKDLPTPPTISPTELSERLSSDPTLTDRYIESPSSPVTNTIRPSTSSTPNRILRSPDEISPPILAGADCSGYFLEPMKWMDSFLSQGQLAGKIPCPNPKCTAKLGNFDWAGLKCGCKTWVVPGFCIARGKVDEIIR